MSYPRYSARAIIGGVDETMYLAAVNEALAAAERVRGDGESDATFESRIDAAVAVAHERFAGVKPREQRRLIDKLTSEVTRELKRYL